MSCKESEPVPLAVVDTPDEGGVLRVWSEHAIDLDPVLVDDIYEGAVTNQIYEGLTQFDEHLGVVPRLAESWTVSDDGLHYQFRIRPGVVFHDGSMLNSDVVCRSLERCLDQDNPGQCLAETYLLQIKGAEEYLAGRTDSIAGLQAIDEMTVEVTLHEPLSFFLSVLAMDQLRIVPLQVGGDTDLAEYPIGTGPFRFVERGEFDGLESLALGANPQYWGQPALLDSLVFVSPRDTMQEEERRSRLLTGDVSGIYVHADEVPQLQRSGFQVFSNPELTFSFVGLSASHPPLDDPRVRRAIAHCVNREGFQGEGFEDVVPASGILPPGVSGYLPEPHVVPYDLDEARRLLAEVGYGPAHPTPTIVLYASGTGRTFQWLDGPFKESLAKVGIPMVVVGISWMEMDERLETDTAPMFSLGWLADVPDPDGFFFPLFHSEVPNNLFAFFDDEVDRALEEARQMRPGPERLQKYRRVEKHILDQAPVIPTYHELESYAFAPEVRGLEIGLYGMTAVNFSAVWLETTPAPSGVAGTER